MVDHVVGAVYFLHHISLQHNALRPENILVDEEGKYIVVDRELFRLKTTYSLNLQDPRLRIPYLSPQ